MDDHPLVFSGVRDILLSEENISDVMQASDIETAISLLSKHCFDLALVDMRLKNETGVEFIEKAKPRYPDCKYVILSSSSTAGDFEKAIKAGVDGYILKDAFPEEIIYAVNMILRGRKYFDPVFMEKKIDSGSGQLSQNPDEPLSPRETEVLFCLGEGLSNKIIADKLFISENTVKKHVSQILAKLNLADRTQAALYASKIKNKNNP